MVKLIGRLVLPMICVLIGWGILAFSDATATNSDEIKCGARVMKVTDTCDHFVNNQSAGTYTYEQERKAQRNTNIFAVRTGQVAIGLGGFWVVWTIIAFAVAGQGRNVTRSQLKPAAASRAELAAAHGWELQDPGPQVLSAQSTGLLVDGTDREARHVLSGRHDDWPFVVFDYLRKPSDGPNKGQLVGTTLWMLGMPEPLPQFELWDKAPHAERRQYVPLSNGFVVKTESLDAVRQVITPEVTAILRERGLGHLIGEERTLISHRDGFYSANKAQRLLLDDLEAVVLAAKAIPSTAGLQQP